MTKAAIKLFITDEGYRSIGCVAAQWAYLETEMDHLLSDFLTQKKVRKLKLSNKQSFKNRIKNLNKAASVLLKKHKKDLKEFNEILTSAASLRGARDDIVHGRWKLKRKGVNKFTGVVTAKSIPSYKYKGIKLTSKQADEVAENISGVTLRLIDWRIQHANKTEGKNKTGQ